MRREFGGVGLALMLFGLAPVSSVQAAPVIRADSFLKATFKQYNVPVTGEFKQFSGDVNFNPKAPEKIQANLDVLARSYDLGDVEYNKELAGPDWFAANQFPKATFKVTSVKPQGDHYQGEGELTLRGKTRKVQFPVKVIQSEGKQIFTGKATIQRLDYGVGQGDWGDTSLVDNAVVVEFRLAVATPGQSK